MAAGSKNLLDHVKTSLRSVLLSEKGGVALNRLLGDELLSGGRIFTKNFVNKVKAEKPTVWRLFFCAKFALHVCPNFVLAGDYRGLTCEILPFKELGYSTLDEFLKSVPDVVVMVR